MGRRNSGDSYTPLSFKAVAKLSNTMIKPAINAFLGGFSFTRGLTHPYLVERIEKVWVLRDAPRRKPPYRNEEWVAYRQPAERVDAIVRRYSRGRFAICAVVGTDDSIEHWRDSYKAIGYRLKTTEPLMVSDLQFVPRFDGPATIERVLTADLADRLNKAARTRQIHPNHLVPDAPIRQYVALVDQKPIGWVRSIVVGPSTWCSNMYIAPEWRRKGIARSLLSRMLIDDKRSGATLAVLSASHVGAKLYPAVGYQQIGTLVVLTPIKR